MKKLFALILALVFAFGMTGCDDELANAALDLAIDMMVESEDYQDAVDSLGGEAGPSAGFYGEEVTEHPETSNSYEETDPPYTDSLPGTEPPEESTAPIDEDGWYYSADDVSLYLYTYGCLPDNFITKDEAEDLGWTGGSVEQYAPGCAIGGDYFGNYEGLLPREKGRTYYECDIDTDGYHSRGSRRIVYSNDGLIYYSDDHYESFVLLYGEE